MGGGCGLYVTAAFLVSSGASNAGVADDTIYSIVLALLLYAMVHAYRTRETAEPPKWMGKLQRASPRFCFVLGVLLLGVLPSDLITSISWADRAPANAALPQEASTFAFWAANSSSVSTPLSRSSPSSFSCAIGSAPAGGAA